MLLPRVWQLKMIHSQVHQNLCADREIFNRGTKVEKISKNNV